jgi:drug/metabolite transporter (DMT)-like permease
MGCTLIAFVLMNRWQPQLSATTAGLIYAAEPVFASLFALFLPAWFGKLGGFDYPNETATVHLLVGGSLITAANVLVQFNSSDHAVVPQIEYGEESAARPQAK